MSVGILARSSSRSSTDITSRPRSNSVDSSSVSEGGRAGPAARGRGSGAVDVGSANRSELYWRSPMESLTLPLDYSAIERILPHRYPFLLVDRITELEPDKRI